MNAFDELLFDVFGVAVFVQAVQLQRRETWDTD